MIQFVLILVVAGLSGLAHPAGAETVAFTNVQLVPMTAERIVPGQTVVVVDGKISAVGSARTTTVPPGARIIDSAGRYLMPGLADMHTHLSDATFEYPCFNLFLANGVTTIRDLTQGAPPSVLHYRGEIEAGKRLGPRILAAYTLWGVEKDITGVIGGQAPLGYDCLKVNSFFTPAGFDTTMREARRLHWYTLGHIPELVGLDGVLAGGMNELSHIEEIMIFEMLGIDWSKVRDHESFEAELMNAVAELGARHLNDTVDDVRAAYADRAKAVAAKLKGREITLTTTAIIHEDVMNKLLDVQKIKAAPSARYIAPKFWTDLASGEDKHRKMIPPGQERIWFVIYQVQNLLLRELRNAGISLVLGTDVGPTYLSLVPGFSVHEELRLLVQNGFTPYEAIALATRRAGEVAGRMTGRNDFGTIETGKRADFILLDRNPLDDVGNLRNPAGVMAHGHWLPADILRGLLDVKHQAIRDRLVETCKTSGADAALSQYRTFAERNSRNEYRYGQGTLLAVGYELLGEGKVEDALRVFRLNVAEYPADWNAFDSYGEACLKAGQKQAAIECYERACALDPTQESPRKVLKELRGG